MANTSDVNQRSADFDFRASIEDFAVEFSVESVAESLGIDEESIDQREALLKKYSKLFISEEGGQIYPGTIDNWVHKICEEAGLPHRTVHSLRHTNITMQIAAGIPLVTVSGRAGHARTSTTTDIYSHFLKSSDKTAAEKLERLFK